VGKEKIKNHFVTAATARRYARGRPFHHPLVMERIRRFTKRTTPFARALDVGCGTGMSTAALKSISDEVVGLDPSDAMLAHAPKARGIQYVRRRAEKLPFPDASFEIVTVSSAFHWLDRSLFLAEAARVLAPRGWLVIYNGGFGAKMRENPDFRRAFRAKYPKRFPTPLRYWRPLSKSDTAPHGLDFRHAEKFTHEVPYTPRGLVEYLATHSNVIAAVEERGEKMSVVRKWLLDLVAPLFRGDEGTFVFGGTIHFVQKMGPSKKSLRRQKRQSKTTKE
jgi:SAM-dependent methyltransferase